MTIQTVPIIKIMEIIEKHVENVLTLQYCEFGEFQCEIAHKPMLYLKIENELNKLFQNNKINQGTIHIQNQIINF